MHPIVGIAVPDERPLAGRIVGWMFFAGAVLTTLLPLLPGANGKVVTPTLPIGIAAGIWGLYAAVRMDWRRARGWVIHAAVMAGQLCAAVAASDTGGAHSPARFLLMLGVVFTAYFFPPREAWPYLGLAIALHALPLAYDHAADRGHGRTAAARADLLPAGVPADHRQARDGRGADARRHARAPRPVDRAGQPAGAGGGDRRCTPGAGSGC